MMISTLVTSFANNTHLMELLILTAMTLVILLMTFIILPYLVDVTASPTASGKSMAIFRLLQTIHFGSFMPYMRQ